MKNFIETKNLVKNYYNGDLETKVLRGIDLEIPKGQFVSIVGPSGAGKSTLLYQLGLLDKPTSGEVFVESKNVSRLDEVSAAYFRLVNYGFVFQEYALVPELTAVEQVMVPCLMTGMNFEAAREVAQDLLTSLGLSHVLEHKPSQLSGGEQQRVSVARAIGRTPKILFADEPTANLDIARSREILHLFLRLNREGQTIVMVTHELEYANLAERMIELRDGEIVGDKKLR
jgi:putative ABC transport system ATP-binding protein